MATAADARDLWLVQLRLECIRLDDAGRMVRGPGDNPDEIATCSAVRFDDGIDIRFSADADDLLVSRATATAPEEFFSSPEVVAERLATSARLQVTWCSTYALERCEPAAGLGVEQNGPEDFSVVAARQQVARATSSRSNAEAAELWVFTEPDHQRRGYGQAVATAWAADVLAAKKIAFYSHLRDNHTSRRLAAKLGAVHLFDLVNLTSAVGSVAW